MSDKNRQHVRKNIAQRRGELKALPAYSVPNDYFADINDGTLKAVVVRSKQPLDVQIPNEPAGVSLGDATCFAQYALMTNGQPGEYTRLGNVIPLPPGTVYPFDMSLPIQDLPENGTFAFNYLVSTVLGDDTSTDYIMIKDTIPPWQDGVGVPPAPTQTPAGTITEKLLTDNSGSITYILKKYSDYATGDLIAVYFEDHVPEESELPGLTPVYTGPFPDADPKFTLTSDKFESLGSGNRYICYVLQDKAGNINISYPLTVHVALGTLPVDLDEPDVPLASDGLLDLKDAGVNPVEALVPSYLSPVHRVDTITLHWGSADIRPYTVNPDTRFPMPVTIPKETLRAQYDKDVGGEQTLQVYYTLSRSDGWTLDSAKHEIKVDFSYVGPDLPDWPDPVNSNLPAPGVNGPISGKPEELDETDKEQDAKFSVIVYDNVQPDDVMDIYWGDSHSPAIRYTMTTEQAGDPLPLGIPWSRIEQAGNAPAVPVWYAIHNGQTPHNEQMCEPITVNVHAVPVPSPKEPSYPTEYNFGSTTLINCMSLRLFRDNTVGVPVDIPPLADPVYKLKAGDIINLEWKPLDSTGGEIPGATITEPKTLDDGMIQNGFSWEVKPFEKVVQPIFDFAEQVVNLEASYSFDVDGTEIPSKKAPNKLAMTQTDFSICDIPTMPFP